MINKSFRKRNDGYTYDMVLAGRLEDGTINKNESAIIQAYIVDKLSKGEIRASTASLIAQSLTQFRRFLNVDFTGLNESEFKIAMLSLRSGNSIDGKPYSDGTRKRMMMHIKPFVTYLGEKRIINEISLKEIKSIKAPKVKMGKYRAEDILSVEEIESMVKACRNSRDRALIMTLYETGARIGEIARLTWGDLIFSETDCRVRLEDEKVGGERFPYIVASSPYLIQYKNDTGSIKNDDFVFLCNGNNNRGNPLTYRAVEHLLENLVKDTGIKKPVAPHLFRASRITNMIKEGYKESIIKKMMWQTLSTPMFDVYVKLADTDIQNEVKAHNGVHDKIKTEARTKQQKCVCGHTNESTANYCSNCARSLKEGVKSIREELSDANGVLLKLLKNPKIIDRLQKLADEE